MYNIGINVKPPEGTCTDMFCPFHGTLPVRGQILEGQVVSDKMQKTAVVKRDYMRKNQKYERFEKRSNKYVVHNPPCLGVETGDNVKIM
ncbi:MAG: 30S ribosomal protein S17, partial [Thermoplasmata archaeon]|nr:30S ribosomal protein S17 [Thermoplasmata archaeon]